MNNMNNRNYFTHQYMEHIESSRLILNNIVNLLELQDEALQRNIMLDSNTLMRRELDFRSLRLSRLPRTNYVRSTPRRWSPGTNSFSYPTPAPTPFGRSSGRDNSQTTNNLSDILNSALSGIIDNSYNPVIVAADPQTLNAATQQLLFSELPQNIQRYHSCPVSHESFNNNSEITRIRHCGHYFSRNAFDLWFNTNVHCPICRHDIRENIPDRENSSNSEGSSNSESSSNRENSSNNNSRNIRMTEASGQTIQDFVNVISNDINNNFPNTSNTVSYQFDFMPENGESKDNNDNNETKEDNNII